MALQRALVVVALRTGGRSLDDPGRAAPRGSRADPHVRAAESRGGEDLKERAESWASATAGPNAAGGQSYRCADAGCASGSRARERLRASARCQTELATELWWVASSRGRATCLSNCVCAS